MIDYSSYPNVIRFVSPRMHLDYLVERHLHVIGMTERFRAQNRWLVRPFWLAVRLYFRTIGLAGHPRRA